jgi:hypothetical protein
MTQNAMKIKYSQNITKEIMKVDGGRIPRGEGGRGGGCEIMTIIF